MLPHRTGVPSLIQSDERGGGGLVFLGLVLQSDDMMGELMRHGHGLCGAQEVCA